MIAGRGVMPQSRLHSQSAARQFELEGRPRAGAAGGADQSPAGHLPHHAVEQAIEARIEALDLGRIAGHSGTFRFILIWKRLLLFRFPYMKVLIKRNDPEIMSCESNG